MQRGPHVAVVAGDRGVAAGHVAAGVAGGEPVLEASEAQADLGAAARTVDPVGAAVAPVAVLSRLIRRTSLSDSPSVSCR